MEINWACRGREHSAATMKKFLIFIPLLLGLTSLKTTDTSDMQATINSNSDEINGWKNEFKTKKIQLPTTTRYYALSPADFVPSADTTLYFLDASGDPYVGPNSTTVQQIWVAPVHLPQGAVVTSVSAWWFRDDALATGTARLQRVTSVGAVAEMANVDSDSSSGNHTVTDSSILNATIDNGTYSYRFRLAIDPNNSGVDCKLFGMTISYTITAPLP